MKLRSHNEGFSILELMISMLIMLVVIGAVVAIYGTSRQTMRTQTAVSRINDNLQLLGEVVARDQRHAGNIGCSGLGLRKVMADSLSSAGSNSTNPYATGAKEISVKTALRLLTAGSADTDVKAKAGFPIVELTTVANFGAHLRNPASLRFSNTVPVEIDGDPGITVPAIDAQNSYPLAILSDCGKQPQLVEVASVTSSGSWKFLTRAAVAFPLGNDARIAPLVTIQYYIADYTAPGDGRTTQALFRRTTKPDGYNWKQGEPLIFDVESFDVLASIDSDSDWEADTDLPWAAVANPEGIVALNMRYSLQEASSQPTGIDATGAAKRISRSYSPWVTIRNRAY